MIHIAIGVGKHLFTMFLDFFIVSIAYRFAKVGVALEYKGRDFKNSPIGDERMFRFGVFVRTAGILMFLCVMSGAILAFYASKALMIYTLPLTALLVSGYAVMTRKDEPKDIVGMTDQELFDMRAEAIMERVRQNNAAP